MQQHLERVGVRVLDPGKLIPDVGKQLWVGLVNRRERPCKCVAQQRMRVLEGVAGSWYHPLA